MEVFILRNVDSGGELRFSHFDRTPNSEGHFQCAVSFRGFGVEASTCVEDYGAGRWGTYFEGLTESWRGWIGNKICKTYHEALQFSATSDALGHISLMVTLQNILLPAWSLQVCITLEAGQLDNVARDARRFFGEPERIIIRPIIRD